MVGHLPLEQSILVRVQVPQPTHYKSSVKDTYESSATETHDGDDIIL